MNMTSTLVYYYRILTFPSIFSPNFWKSFAETKKNNKKSKELILIKKCKKIVQRFNSSKFCFSST